MNTTTIEQQKATLAITNRRIHTEENNIDALESKLAEKTEQLRALSNEISSLMLEIQHAKTRINGLKSARAELTGSEK